MIMTRQDVFERVTALVKPFARDPEAFARISEKTSILDDLKVNSARLVDIVIAFEESFGIAIPDSQVDSVDTVGDAVNVVMAQIQQ